MLKQQPLCDLYGSIDVKGAFVCVPINWKSSNDRLSSDMMDVVSWWNSNSPSNHQKRTIHKLLIEGNIVRSTVSNSGLNDYNCSIWSLFMVNQYSLMDPAVCSLHMITQSMLNADDNLSTNRAGELGPQIPLLCARETLRTTGYVLRQCTRWR